MSIDNSKFVSVASLWNLIQKSWRGQLRGSFRGSPSACQKAHKNDKFDSLRGRRFHSSLWTVHHTDHPSKKSCVGKNSFRINWFAEGGKKCSKGIRKNMHFATKSRQFQSHSHGSEQNFLRSFLAAALAVLSLISSLLPSPRDNTKSEASKNSVLRSWHNKLIFFINKMGGVSCMWFRWMDKEQQQVNWLILEAKLTTEQKKKGKANKTSLSWA